MTKADIVSNISDQLGIDRADVLATVENFMKEVKASLEKGENVYLRGFGSFIIKTRAEKTGRDISKMLPSKFLHITFLLSNPRKYLFRVLNLK